MSLEPVKGTLGLWRVPDWKRNRRGVYALIAGASAYPHLSGGTDEAPDTYQLEQLISSASTAAQFFDWLRNTYRCGELEVVWCYLLLAPTKDEAREFEKNGLVHWALPTNANLRDAIQAWTGNLPVAEDARASRTLFFFSGHGVQSNKEPLILPSDYLDPKYGAPQFENCISVNELKQWMSESPIGEHVALVDACRNEFSPLAGKASSAHRIFGKNERNEPPPRSWAVLSAASQNTVAYQLRDKPMSIFGQAVLEGLRGRNQAAKDVQFIPLVGYVRRRVNEILKESLKSPISQSASQSNGDAEEMVMTELHGLGALESFAGEEELVFGGPANGESLTLEATTRALDARFEPSATVETPIALPNLGVGSEAFDRFGHEYASEIWRNGRVRALSLGNGQPLPAGLDVVIARTARNQSSYLVQVDLALPRLDSGVLLVFDGNQDVQRERLALMLPTDSAGEVPIRLTLTIEPLTPNEPPKIQGIDARFGPPLPKSISTASERYCQYVWDLYREAELGSLADAAKSADVELLKAAVREKLLNPTSAMAAALLLAEAGHIASIADWARNLMTWFSNLPDGAVLWAESLRSAIQRGASRPFEVGDPVQEAARSLCELETRGVPFLSGVSDLAERLARWLLRQDLEHSLRDRVLTVQKMIELADSVSVESGHFTLLSGTPRPPSLPGQGALSVEELLAIARPRPRRS